ncbi:hypothetical protein EDF22_3728 [Rathayibacter sp. PhB127]|uniref:hypothetical protein n=1 Tax=unclassified Rathayibacter TaxID=2609250 RepID=UPI000FAA4829|nr:MULTISPECIES: hypothetical protein [unclassified Rathayibacter]ROS21471.1 hypothetical protein EDF22_3728 [Rathayibacter sp. PhB127]
MDRRAAVPFRARLALSSALIDLGLHASRSLIRLAEREKAESSEAYRWQTVGGQMPLATIHRLALVSTDHYHAFARLLRLAEPYAPSLASLARSFGEVSGKAWWLLESTSAEQLSHRTAALKLSDTTSAGKREISTFGPDGVSTPVADPLQSAQAALTRSEVSGKREKVPNYTQSFELACSKSELKGGTELYRHLSGAAHGSLLTMGSLTHVGPQNADGSAYTYLALSLDLTESYLDALVGIMSSIVRRVSVAYDAQDELERLRQVVIRVDDSIRAVLREVEYR